MESSSTWWRTHLAFAVDASPSSLCIEGPPGGLAWPSETLMQLVNASVNATTKSALPSSINCTIFAQYVQTFASRPRRIAHHSCAVVGSSGDLRRASHGASIDKHDAIFRINNAPTRRYTHNVGSRTTYRIATQFPWRILLTHAQSQLVNPDGSRVAPLLYCHNGWIGNCHRDVLREQWWKKSPALLVNPALVGAVMRAMYAAPKRGKHAVARLMHRKAPSSGLIATAVALSMCGNVTLFGFSNYTKERMNRLQTSNTSSMNCAHYYACQLTRRQYLQQPHDWARQWQLLQALAASGAIRLAG